MCRAIIIIERLCTCSASFGIRPDLSPSEVSVGCYNVFSETGPGHFLKCADLSTVGTWVIEEYCRSVLHRTIESRNSFLMNEGNIKELGKKEQTLEH